jgi:hypothetical protein
MTDPDDGDDLDQNAQFDEDDTLEDTGVEDPLDRGYSPPERPWAADDWGTTAREEREGEPLDERLDRELPDVGERDPLDEIAEDEQDPRDVDDETGENLGDDIDSDGELIDDEVGDERTGRLASETGEFDEDLFAEDAGIDGAGASAEEAAVHTVRE